MIPDEALEELPKGPVAVLADILRDSGARLCFCSLCAHQESYGHCYACSCHNHVPEPITPDARKLQDALEHVKDVLRSVRAEPFPFTPLRADGMPPPEVTLEHEQYAQRELSTTTQPNLLRKLAIAAYRREQLCDSLAALEAERERVNVLAGALRLVVHFFDAPTAFSDEKYAFLADEVNTALTGIPGVILPADCELEIPA